MNKVVEEAVLTVVNEYAMAKNEEFCHEALRKVDMKLCEYDFNLWVSTFIKASWYYLCKTN